MKQLVPGTWYSIFHVIGVLMAAHAQCASSLPGAPLTPWFSCPAFRRLALVLYDDQRFNAAEAALTRGASGVDEPSPLGLADLLLLSKAQVCILLYALLHCCTRFPCYSFTSLCSSRACILSIRYQVSFFAK